MGRRRLAVIHIFVLCSFITLVHCASAQDADPLAAVVPPPRTITTTLKPERPAKTVDIHFFDDQKRICHDSYKVESSRKTIHAGQGVTFSSRISRKCNEKSVGAPIPLSASFHVRAVGSKKNASDSNQKQTVDSNAFSFSYTFKSAGTYQVSIVHQMSESETHTVSLTINVLPAKTNAPTTENTD